MDFKKIQELIKIVGESNLTTVEIEQEGFRILLQKETEKIVVSGSGIPGTQLPSVQSYAPAAPPVTAEGPAAAPAETREAKKTINSPIVGTFYSASSPGEPPFVQPGSIVKKGDTLCIIEAMKLMNEIEAEEDLQILEVLAKDGDMIEYGQALFSISK